MLTCRRVLSLVVVIGTLGASSTTLAQPAVDASAGGEAAAANGATRTSSRVGQGHGFFKRRGYLHIAPGIMAVSLTRAAGALYSWGLSGGYHVPVTGKFVLEVGGFFDHAMSADKLGYVTRHLFAIGPELRLGGGTPKIFGYGLVRLGVGISRVRFVYWPPVPELPPAVTFTETGFLMTLGGGLQGLVHPNIALGGEPAFDFVLPGTGFFRLRFFIAVLF